MQLNLGQNKDITVAPAVPAETITTNTVEVISISDDCVSEVKAVISVQGINKVLVLWSGSAYAAVGDWTQAQANARIIELL